MMKGRVKVTLMGNGRGRVELDGQVLENVERVVVIGQVNRPPRVRVTFLAIDGLDVEADARCAHRHVAARYDGDSSWWACADCGETIDKTVAMTRRNER